MTTPDDAPKLEESAQAVLGPLHRPAPRRWPLVRRVAAFLVDSMLLWAVGMIIGAVLADVWTRLAWSGPLVGLAIAITFFGVLDSRAAGGRSFGKRLLGLRVVDARGNAPALQRALLRAAVLSAPVVLNGMTLPPSSSLLHAALSTIIFGVGPVVFLLPLLSRPAGGFGFHELVSGTRVVEASGLVEPLAPPPRFLVPGAVAWIAVALAFLFPTSSKPSPVLDALLAITAKEDLVSLKLWQNHTRFDGIGGTEEFSSVDVTAWSKRAPETFPQTVAALTQHACELVPGIASARFVQVNVRYGWSLGIARSFMTFKDRAPPACGTAAGRATPKQLARGL